MGNNFLDAMESATNYTRTENAALTYKSTGSALLDFFSRAGSMRAVAPDEINSLFSAAFGESKLYATKALFYLRDVRGGQGERRVPKVIYNWLMMFASEVLVANMDLLPHYGRWDEVVYIYAIAKKIPRPRVQEAAADLLHEQLFRDLESNHPSLLAKWLPSENASNKTTRNIARDLSDYVFNFRNYRTYRKTISRLRQRISVVEQKMSANAWDQITFEHVPSRAMSIYKQAFSRHQPQRFHEFLNAVQRGEKEIKASTLYPHEIVAKGMPVLSSTENKLTRTDELQWQNLPDYTKGENALVVADTSGSMFQTFYSISNKDRPINISVALALYFAERNSGQFNGYFINFSQRPNLNKVKGTTLQAKINNLANTEWGFNTDLQAVFELILSTALKKDIPPEEMPSTLYIVSDMEFDQCAEGTQTNLESIQQKYQSAGYKMPRIVFWNVEARTAQSPATVRDDGVVVISGKSPATFKLVYESNSLNPYDVMIDILDSSRYTPVREPH